MPKYRCLLHLPATTCNQLHGKRFSSTTDANTAPLTESPATNAVAGQTPLDANSINDTKASKPVYGVTDAKEHPGLPYTGFTTNRMRWAIRLGDIIVGVTLGGALVWGFNFMFDWPDVCQTVVETACLDPFFQEKIGIPAHGSYFWSGTVRPRQFANVSIPVSGPNGKGQLSARCRYHARTGLWHIHLLEISFPGSSRLFSLTMPRVPHPLGDKWADKKPHDASQKLWPDPHVPPNMVLPVASEPKPGPEQKAAKS
jgi:hypothetical protein